MEKGLTPAHRLRSELGAIGGIGENCGRMRGLDRARVSPVMHILYTVPMTNEASQLMAEALKVVKVTGSFSPEEIGARIGMDKSRAEIAARALSNAGVLVLGFDCAAHFSPDFRKANLAAQPKIKGKSKKDTEGRSGGKKRRLAKTSAGE
jgi:hypothetical protein